MRWADVAPVGASSAVDVLGSFVQSSTRPLPGFRGPPLVQAPPSTLDNKSYGLAAGMMSSNDGINRPPTTAEFSRAWVSLRSPAGLTSFFLGPRKGSRLGHAAWRRPRDHPERCCVLPQPLTSFVSSRLVGGTGDLHKHERKGELGAVMPQVRICRQNGHFSRRKCCTYLELGGKVAQSYDPDNAREEDKHGR